MAINVGILGATGYTGAELLRILLVHPAVSVSLLSSEKFSGQRISEVFPEFEGHSDLVCSRVADLSYDSGLDVVFSCLPHGISSRFVSKFLDAGTKVIDFSSDFRFGGSEVYRRLYNKDHKFSEYLDSAVYGLPELNRDKIKGSSLVANPGCYATSVILGLLPLAENSLLSAGSIIADVKAGSSGAGRAPTLSGHYPEVNESMAAEPESARDQELEMELKLSDITASAVNVTFTPHKAPMNRGILATIYCGLNDDIEYSKLFELYEERFRDETFVSLAEEGKFPSTKEVTYSNMCRIGLAVKSKTVVITSVLDNLGKGASGQAVQNMNIMLGLPEETGLINPALYP